MPTKVVMPQMGESLSEGTLTKWLKKVGDRVARDEPLFEISTDKVDTEIPAPASGTLEQILVGEGQTVLVGTVVAHIGTGETQAAEAPSLSATEVKPGGGHFVSTHEPTTFKRRDASPAAVAPPSDRRDYFSPAVMTAAHEHQVPLEELSRIQGSGLGGRITKKDVETHVAGRGAAPRPSRPEPRALEGRPAALYKPAAGDRVVPMGALRKKMADDAVQSHRTAAQATSFAECDLNRIVRYRDQNRAAFETAEGIPLTFLPFVADATVRALKEFPLFNASVVGDEIVLKKHVHLGIAVAVPEGVVTPVVRHADEMNFVGLARAIHGVTQSVESESLPEGALEGATFTVINPGMFGGLTGTLLIPPPQVAILGLGAVTKKPVVIDDAIAIRPIMVLALSFDHRLIDPATAFQFLEQVRLHLEHFELP